MPPQLSDADLADVIAAVLRAKSSPLTAREICDELSEFGVLADRTLVNRVLYSGNYAERFIRVLTGSQAPCWRLNDFQHRPTSTSAQKWAPSTGVAFDVPEITTPPSRTLDPPTRTLLDVPRPASPVAAALNPPAPNFRPKYASDDELPAPSPIPPEVEVRSFASFVVRTVTLGPINVEVVDHSVLCGAQTHSASSDADTLGEIPVATVGTVLANRYEIVSVLGSGGMGRVYCARDIELQRYVALKAVLRGTPTEALALHNEVELLSRIDRADYFPRVYRIVEHDRLLFVPMDLLDGRDLFRWLADRNPQDVDRHFVTLVFDQVCACLEYLHNFLSGQILFRDLKPSNVMVEESPLRVRLVDFGIASMAGRRSGLDGGTRGFIAPEVQSEGRYSVKSDLFSLGRLLECLLLAAPKPPAEAISRIPFAADRGLPARLLLVAARLTATRPGDRPENVHAAKQLFHNALREDDEQDAEVGTSRHPPCNNCGAPQERSFFLCWRCGFWLKDVGRAQSTPPVDPNAAKHFRSTLDDALEPKRPKTPPTRMALIEEAAAIQRIPAYEELLCVPDLPFEPYGYQADAALRVLRDLHGRAILADEVGLGKTIEAGLVIKEYLVRREAKRILILTPPAMRQQWRDELRTKFGISASSYGNVKVGDDAEDPSIFGREECVVIASHHRARSGLSGVLTSKDWDAVVVDEAHHAKAGVARNGGNLLGRLVASLRARRMLLLTATPAQNSLEELFRLVSLVRPGLLGANKRSFDNLYAGRDRWEVTGADHLRSQLRDVMIRNRRASVHRAFPSRRAQTIEIELTAKESSGYRDVVGALQARAEGALVLSTQTRQFCTSYEGLAKGAKLPEVVAAVTRLRSNRHFKLRVLLERLLPRFRSEKEAKVIVFSHFIESQREIFETLRAEGENAVWAAGGDPAARFKALATFKKDCAVRFLVAGSGISEGLNLQFCRCMVNFDLPWNPQQIEQRIGRIQRLGSPHREVLVLNLIAKETIEELVIEYIEKKLGMFETVFGSVEAILGEFGEEDSVEGYITEALRRGRSGGIDPITAGEGRRAIEEARLRMTASQGSPFDDLLGDIGVKNTEAS